MSKKVEPNLELTALFMMLKDHGATHIVVRFSGSGDSGDFDEKYAIPNTLVNENNDLKEDIWSPAFDNLRKGMPEIPSDKEELLVDIANAYTKSHDWWNNDGGDGYIVINMTTLEYHTHYSINTMTNEVFTESGNASVE